MSYVPITADDIRNLLVEAIAAEASIPPTEVAADRPFTAYGLDSMAMMSVGVEIEDACGLSNLPPSLLWDYPTVAALTEALWARMTVSPTNTVSALALSEDL